MLTAKYIELEEQYGAHNYHPLDVVIERASGCWVYDTDGKRYLDCLAAYSAVNQGHCHPKILQAMLEQAHKVTLTSRAFRNDQLPLFYEQLHQLTGFEMSLPMNSGAEAVETALKVVRRWGYAVKGIPQDRAEIIVCADNFHGRTISIVSFSSDPQYRKDFGPFTPGFKVVPFGDVRALREAITPHTCAFLIEPIQGEAGIIVPPEGYLAEAAALCRENNVLLMCDEIQSGLGRTGKMFAYEHDDVVPDVLILGKALSGGYYPVSAVLASRAILGLFEPGDHGSTFGGNPLACAVARAALKVLVDEQLVARSAELGPLFMAQLREIDSPHINAIRGRGLWIAIELNVPARPICEALKAEGILCKETHVNCIRLAPPLTITRDEIAWASGRIRAVLEGLDSATNSPDRLTVAAV
ncbi:ornithine--oxo-acid transaminase [Granulicella arctica]|uniref:ornithine--oxo-acid transaminase n=1 Tax=Granulicella arctica TaxID=940613 RepID=UPI0021DF7000|nr:ornithine--oxo-acid transaminase [Granulicella arctica]